MLAGPVDNASEESALNRTLQAQASFAQTVHPKPGLDPRMTGPFSSTAIARAARFSPNRAVEGAAGEKDGYAAGHGHQHPLPSRAATIPELFGNAHCRALSSRETQAWAGPRHLLGQHPQASPTMVQVELRRRRRDAAGLLTLTVLYARTFAAMSARAGQLADQGRHRRWKVRPSQWAKSLQAIRSTLNFHCTASC